MPQDQPTLGMHEFLILGKGMTTHPTVPISLLADVFESLIAAIYLDGGDAAAREFIERHMGPEIALAADDDSGSNYKSVLQQVAQASMARRPPTNYWTKRVRIIASALKSPRKSGPHRYQAAWGRNKKEAEQRTARTPCTSSKASRLRSRSSDRSLGPDNSRSHTNPKRKRGLRYKLSSLTLRVGVAGCACRLTRQSRPIGARNRNAQPAGLGVSFSSWQAKAEEPPSSRQSA